MNEVQIAKEFCQILNWWLTAEQMAEVVRRNTAETNSNICHSHDFCDANEAMIVALSNAGVDTDDMEMMNDDAMCSLWNAAWNLAKSVGFDGDKL